MTVTYLPQQHVQDERAQENFEFIESHGVFNLSPVAVTGSRGGNAALASLLTALASYGIIIDNTTP